MKTLKIKDLTAEGAAFLSGMPDASFEARLLLMSAASLDENGFFLEPEAELGVFARARYFRLLSRRKKGIPVAYLTGKKEFWSRSFLVRPGVLIPRPETELLVEKTLELSGRREVSVLDMGTGSGILAITLALELPSAGVTAVDISRRALRVARQNALLLNAPGIRFMRSDLFKSFGKPAPLFDIIVSNPPYIGRKEREFLAPEVRDHEPHRALFGGVEGTEFAARLIEDSLSFLKPRGLILMEIGAGQTEAVVKMFGQEWDSPEVYSDLAGIPRVVAARKIPA